MSHDEYDEEELTFGRDRWMVALAVVAVLLLVLPAGAFLLDRLATGRAAGEVAAELDEAEQVLLEAVVLLRAPGGSGGVVSGTAFALGLDDRTVLVTNAHVVEGACRVAAVGIDGQPLGNLQVTGVARDVDVATLSGDVDLAALPPASASAEEGQPVRFVGFPGALPETSAGQVDDVSGERLRLDLRVDPGASGSPVVDAGGAVVGQVFARDRQGRGVASTLDAVRAGVAAAQPPRGCDA